jgi:hypothetical protein
MEDEAERNGWLMRIAASPSHPAWIDVLMELEYQERMAFEALLHGASKEEVEHGVLKIRKLKRLPQEAVEHAKHQSPGKPEQGAKR